MTPDDLKISMMRGCISTALEESNQAKVDILLKALELNTGNDEFSAGVRRGLKIAIYTITGDDSLLLEDVRKSMQEIRWTNKVSLDSQGNIVGFNGEKILPGVSYKEYTQTTTCNQEEIVDIDYNNIKKSEGT